MSSRGRPQVRLARLLLGRNELRRPSDRIEGCVIAVLLAAFLIAAVTAGLLAVRSYQSQRAAAGLEPAVAVLAQAGPDVSATLVPTVTVRAAWKLPDGTRRTGLLSTLTAPGISYAAAGSTVPVWLDRSGRPLTAPPGSVNMTLNALFVAVCVLAVAALVLALCYFACRLILERHRLSQWESAWAAVGPQWTSRR